MAVPFVGTRPEVSEATPNLRRQWAGYKHLGAAPAWVDEQQRNQWIDPRDGKIYVADHDNDRLIYTGHKVAPTPGFTGKGETPKGVIADKDKEGYYVGTNIPTYEQYKQQYPAYKGTEQEYISGLTPAPNIKKPVVKVAATPKPPSYDIQAANRRLEESTTRVKQNVINNWERTLNAVKGLVPQDLKIPKPLLMAGAVTTLTPVPFDDLLTYLIIGGVVGSAALAGYTAKKYDLPGELTKAYNEFTRKNKREPTVGEISVNGKPLADTLSTKAISPPRAGTGGITAPSIPKAGGKVPVNKELTAGGIPKVNIEITPLTTPMTTPGKVYGSYAGSGSINWREPVVTLPGTNLTVPKSIIDDQNDILARTGTLVATLTRVKELPLSVEQYDRIQRTIRAGSGAQILNDIFKQSQEELERKRSRAARLVTEAAVASYIVSIRKQQKAIAREYRDYVSALRNNMPGASTRDINKAAGMLLSKHYQGVSPASIKRMQTLSASQLKNMADTSNQTMSDIKDMVKQASQTSTSSKSATQSQLKQLTRALTSSTAATTGARALSRTAATTAELTDTATAISKFPPVYLPPGASDKKKREYIKQSKGAMSWRQGELGEKNDVWYTVVYPYNQKPIVVVGKAPVGARHVEGPGSAFKTAKRLYGNVLPKGFKIDVGFQDVTIDGTRLKYKPDPGLVGTRGRVTAGRPRGRITRR